MPFKDKLIQDMQKIISQFSETQSSANSNMLEQKPRTGKNYNKKHQKAIFPKIKNIYQMFLAKTPRVYVHVANFFNMLGINQEAIRSDDFQESYCRTVFYLKSIKKAEMRSNCVVFHLSLSNFCFSPIQYTIQRFKSFGESRFFNMATLMQQVVSKLNELKKHVGKQIKQENNDAFEKYIESLRNRIFVVKTSSKLVLSNSFLQLLQYNPQEYTIESVKFRSSLYEGCSTKNYYEVMMKSLQNIKNLIDLLFDRISLETFLDNSIMRFKDYLYTRNNKVVFAKVKAGMPTPFLTIYEIEEVISISENFTTKAYFNGEKGQKLNAVKQEFTDSDIKAMRNLMKLPPSFLPQNKHKVANFLQVSSHIKNENIQNS